MPDESTHPEGQPDPQLTAQRATPDTRTTPEGTIVQLAPPSFVRPARPAPAAQVPGFDLLEEIGRGGMGVVYKARQHGLGRVVALKMVLHGAHATAEELDRFRAEAEAIARLRHVNIVEVYAYGETEAGLPYFALEFCEGGTLAARCAQPLPLRDAVGIAAALAQAVQAAHAAGIVHRDLKPANVLLTAGGVPKVTDFGLAKGLGEAHVRTQTGAVLGTPAYMAPEQAAGHTGEIGPAADVYALGAILYYLLTGRPPFDGGNVAQTIQAVQRDEPACPRRLRKDIPPDLEAVILRCLEKAPAERYASAAELAADLERWLRGEPVRAHRRGAGYRARKWLGRNRRWVAAGAGLALLFLAGWVGAADGGLAVPGGDWARRQIDRHELSVQRPAPSVETLRLAGAQQRRELALHMLHPSRCRDGWVAAQSKDDQPFEYADAWTQTQATACLLLTPEAPDDALRPVVAALHTGLFGKNPLCPPYDADRGWLHYDSPASESCAWAAAAIPAALRRPGLCTPAERALLLRRLEQLQATLDLCSVRDPQTGADTGRWNLAPRPIRASHGNIFTTLLVYQALLEQCRAGLPWRGDHGRRDALFRLTHSAILDQFDGRGWLTRGRSDADLNDGLTLQLFALLLRAERYGLAALPPAVAEQIPRHLAECRTRAFDHPVTTTPFELDVHGDRGEKIVIQRPVRFLWHPWSTETAARRLARLIRTGGPHDQTVEARRVLGHLLIDLGPRMIEELKNGYTYVLMETLLGLDALDDLP